MSDLDEQKLRAEILLLEQERRAVIVRIRLDVLKGVAVALGALAVFWFIQNPDSIVNREVSKDSLARERAALILDCLKEENPSRRRQALAVVRAVYGRSEDKWLEGVEAALQEKAGAEVRSREAGRALKSTQDPKLQELLRRKQELAIRASMAYEEMIRELEGTGGSRNPGSGPVFREKQRMAEELESKLAQIETEIADHQRRAGAGFSG